MRKRQAFMTCPPAAELDASARTALETGHDFRDYFGAPQDEALVREAWIANRPALLADWIAARPSTRPWAWWKFDAPEPRRRHIAGALPACDEASAPAWVRAAISFGVCDVAGRRQLERPPVYETEAAYLERHGLLTSADAAAATSAAA